MRHDRPASTGLRTPRAAPSTALLALALLLPAAPLGAQETNLSGRIVDDETGEAVGGASVTLLTDDGDLLDRTVAGPGGEFQFTFEDVGRIRLLSERIGYTDSFSPTLYTDGRALFEVELRMSVDAILLAPLEVLAWSRPRNTNLAEFERRREGGLGRYITRDVIEERNPPRVTDLLATVPGVRLQSSGRGNRRAVYMGRAGSCPASIWVDGMLVNRGPTGAGISIDEVVSPESVYGIEVYGGAGSVPGDFIDEGRCGAVVVWTRRSADR